MSRWFRMYDEILDDPKVQKLSPDLFRLWVNTLALCSRSGGKLPSIADIAFALRETEESVSSAFHTLAGLGMLVTDGETFQPKNWKKRQYKSDSSTARVREHRKRSRNGDETPPDTETDTENTLAKANALDLEKVVFEQGLELLAANGVPEKRARPWLGKLKRDYGAANVISALSRAKREGALDIIPFVEGALRTKAKTYDRDRITV